MPAGSSRAMRLDPFALPLRFQASDKAADERIRSVELTRERVVLRRAVRGIKMAVHLPMAAYLGVAIRLQPPADGCPATITIILEHHDPALSLELFRAPDAADVAAEWQSWGRVLGLPLLVAESDGKLREPFERLGSVETAEPAARRRRHTVMEERRPSILLRRQPGATSDEPVVHRDEREIIARD